MGLFKHYGSTQAKTKSRRVVNFGIPKLGQIALSRDPGDAASLFSSHFLRTNLRIRKFDSYGQLVLDENLGAGLVTNVGVLALAGDLSLAAVGKAKEPFNLFDQLKWQAWSKSATGAAVFDTKLAEPQAPNTTKATEVTTREVGVSGIGSPKFITKGKIKAEGTTEIKSWGLFSQKESIAGTTFGGGKLTGRTENTATITGATEWTASTDEIKGERLSIVQVTEAEKPWLLVKENSKTVATGFTGGGATKAWFKESDGTFSEPGATATFLQFPVLWDHKVFTTVGVELNNEIEFIYELTFPSGG